MFAHGREPDNVFDLSSRRHQDDDRPVSISQKIAERELARREALDDGDRAAVAMLHDGLGPDPAPRLSIRETTYVGGGLETIRAEAMDLAAVVDGKQPGELHQRLMAMVAEVEDLSVKLAEWSTGSAA